ncbi:LPS export ABC transporter periplasmic protein LptC [candidate division KSB1 bacterium]|nr:LPS export ABC transporter periplasmic protein LptC [candidate division KSB1 bacterium]
MKNLLALIFLLIFIIAACEREEPPSGVSGKKDVPDQEMWNSTVTSMNKGHKEAVVNYGHMLHYAEKKIYEFDENVMVDFYNMEGQHASRLTARKGEMDERTNLVKAMGNVVVVSDSGVTLYTEEVYYDQNIDKIISNVDVLFTRAVGDTMYGTGFESDPQLNNYIIKNPHGKAHKGIDLSGERWKKPKDELPDSIKAHTDSLDTDS